MTKVKFWGLLCLFLIIAIAILSPIPSHNDLPGGFADFSYHTVNIFEAIHSFSSGHFWLRAAPTLNHGWVYPVFQFYSPFAYTMGGLIGMIDPNNAFQCGFKYTLILAAVVGAFYCYRLYILLFKNEIAAILGAALYLFSPYLLLNINVRGDFAESFSQCIVPVTLYYWFCLSQHPRWDRTAISLFLKATLAYYCLMTSHLITFISTTFFMLLLFSSLSRSRGQFKNMLLLASCMLVTSCLAAWYLAPLVLTHSILNIATAINSPWVMDFTTNIATLLAPKALAISPNFAHFYLAPSLGIPLTLSAGYWIYQFYIKRMPLDIAQACLIKTTLWIFLFAFVLTWTPINFWQFLPRITYVIQFSYRLLTDLMWLGGILFVAMLSHAYQNKLDLRHVIFGILLISLANSQWLSSNYTHNDSIFLRTLQDPSILLRSYSSDYLVNLKLFHNTDPLAQTVSPSLPVEKTQSFCQKETPTTIHCTLNIMGPQQFIQLPILYYPHLLTIRVNGKAINYYPSASKDQYRTFLLATIRLPAGPQHITASFTGLELANSLSVLSWGLLILMAFYFLYSKSKSAKDCSNESR